MFFSDMASGIIEYRLPGGWTVLAGKTDKDNDDLSLGKAGPNDWWFHARGMAGSHVVLRVPPDIEPDRLTLERAAAVAAYHSKARNGGVTPVSCTRVRYVTKLKGSKAGSVCIRKETVLKVRPEIPESEFGGCRRT